ncbi:MAG: ABC transporter substrate-binding protein, partial [Acidimicrobiales bacterium]
MGKFRVLLGLLLAFALVAAACGSDDDDAEAAEESEETSTTAAAAEEPADDEEPAEEEAAEEEPEETGGDPASCAENTPDGTAGVDKDAGVIKIGTSQPFTGRAAVAGEGLLGGVQMAVDEVNANGGIDGCTFELAWEDDRFEIEQMVTNIRRLIDEEQVWAIVSPAGSQAIPGSYEF